MRLSETQVDPSPFIVETIFNVRYAETDAMGIVHHSAYVVWLEEGRSAWFRERLQDARGYALMEADGYALAVTELNMRFLASARYGDSVRVRTWITAVRSRMIDVSYVIENAETGVSLLRARSTHLCVDAAMQVISIPGIWAERLAPG